MSTYEEAKVMKTGGVVIRYYFGKTVLIPAEVMKREAIPMGDSEESIKNIVKESKIALRPRRFADGRI